MNLKDCATLDEAVKVFLDMSESDLDRLSKPEFDKFMCGFQSFIEGARWAAARIHALTVQGESNLMPLALNILETHDQIRQGLRAAKRVDVKKTH